MTFLLATLFLLALIAFTALRLRTYLHIFQQEEYDAPRLLAWWKEKKAFDRWATAPLAAAFIFTLILPPLGLLAAAIALAWAIYKEPNPTRGGKKPLILTTRAHNIWLAALALAAVATFLCLALPAVALPLAAIALIQAAPLALIAANVLLSPVQNLQNRRYLTEAQQILARLQPTTIGITGSFGKTSTKFILNHLLSTHAPTLMTPGSINTPLGIARVVRENLQPQHTYFIAEMGAYGPGSIARLCNLAPPRISCITAIGEAHYERFKSLQTVAQAKFEIAEATYANGGITVLSIDGILPELWQPRVQANPTAFRLVGSEKKHLRPTDIHIAAAEQTPKGLKLTLARGQETFTFQTPLFGKAQTGNLATAFTLALELGLPAKSLTAAMAKVPAAPHRLAVKQEGTSTLIDDSYNANPKGFESALEVLTLIAGGKRRRILVTPGMVELGAKHDAEHARLGTLAAHHADIILALAPTRIPTFVQSAVAANAATVIPLQNLAEARQWLAQHGEADDVILIENDLPERYEARWTL